MTSKKKQDMIKVNNSFDTIIFTLSDMTTKVRPLMPLVADSLEFTVKLVQLYKTAFNKGLEK